VAFKRRCSLCTPLLSRPYHAWVIRYRALLSRVRYFVPDWKPFCSPDTLKKSVEAHLFLAFACQTFFSLPVCSRFVPPSAFCRVLRHFVVTLVSPRLRGIALFMPCIRCGNSLWSAVAVTTALHLAPFNRLRRAEVTVVRILTMNQKKFLCKKMIPINYKYGYIAVILCTFSIYTNKRYYFYAIYLVLIECYWILKLFDQWTKYYQQGTSKKPKTLRFHEKNDV